MMTVDHGVYFETLYPFQDRVLQTIAGLETGFYLSGGTAASRGYLNHRFSDALDLFVVGAVSPRALKFYEYAAGRLR